MKPKRSTSAATCLIVATVLAVAPARAHDTWVQVSRSFVRPGDVVHVDLMLGNHGNDHRDFKIAGKLGSFENTTLEVRAPGGRATDLVPVAIDVGLAPKEGFFSSRFVADAPGLHCIAHTREGVRHGSRGLKSAKAYFLVSERLDAPGDATGGFATPIGHALELVPETHPVLGCGPGLPIVVRLLHRGRPLDGHRVSFIPRGSTLAEGLDPEFERTTDVEGRCSWTPREGNLVLVVARHTASDGQAEDHGTTACSATLLLDVPQRPVPPAGGR